MKKGLLVPALLLVVALGWSQGQSSAQDTSALAAEGFAVQEIQGYVIGYKVVGTDLEVYANAPTTGWLAVGFAPTRQMKDANIIIGHVRDGVATIRDDFGITNTGHGPDTRVGGVDNVTLIASGESEGRTFLRFRIPLDSGTPGDRPMAKGSTYPAIWAFGPNNRDDFTTPHIRRGGFQLSL